MENSQSLHTILNHLGNTAVYVIRQDDHKLLYFNDRVKQVTPHAELGIACHDLWKGACGNCPLHGIGNKETNKTVNYNDPFGKVVDLAATRLEWGEDKIPAFLISVTPRTLLMDEQAFAAEKNKLLAIASRIYPLVISVNLTKDEYSVVESGKWESWLPVSTGCCSEMLMNNLSYIHPDFRERYKAVLDIKGLERAFASGEKEIYFEYRERMRRTEYQWSCVQVVAVDNPVNSDVMALFLFKGIQEQKERADQLQKERERLYDSFPGAMIKCIMDERLTFLEANTAFYNMFGSPNDYADGTGHAILKEDRESVLPYFHAQAAAGAPIAAEYRVLNQNGELRWIGCRGNKAGNERGYPVYLFLLNDITVQKMEQLKLKQERTRYKVTVENAALAMFEYLADQDIFRVIIGTKEGYHTEETEDYLKRLEQFTELDPQGREQLRRLMRGEETQAEFCVCSGNQGDTLQWYQMQGNSLWDHGRLQRVQGFLWDISEVKEIEKELTLQEKAVNTTLDAIITQAFDELLYLNLEQDNLILAKANGRYQTAIDLQRPQVKENIRQTLHPDDRNKLFDAFSKESLIQKFRKSWKPVYEEGRRLGLDGRYHWISLQAIPIERNEAGEHMVLFLISTIDERKKLEQEMQMMSASMISMFGELLVVDLKSGRYELYKSDPAVKRVASIVGGVDFIAFNRHYGDNLIHPDDRKQFFHLFSLPQIRQRIRSGERKLTAEMRRKNADGVYRWCEMIGVIIDNTLHDDFRILLTFRDIHELRTAQQEQKNANKRFVSAVNDFYDIIYEGELYSQRLYIWKQPELWRSKVDKNTGLGEHLRNVCEKLVLPEYREEFWNTFEPSRMIEAFGEGKKAISMEVPNLCHDGIVRWYNVQVQLIEQRSGHMQVMIYIKDIDELRREEHRRQEALKNALMMAKNANEAKSDFLSRMSHDIRTPMNAIIGMTTIASAYLDRPEKIADCLQKIGVSAKFLLGLINDVLDMSKIESGKMDIKLAEFDLYELVGEITSFCFEQAKAKRQQFYVHVDSRVEQRYVGDALHLNQVLLNLLGNAMKYTQEEGTISLLVDLENVREDASTLRMTVRDNGIGMSESFLEHLFEPFEQEKDDDGRVFEGSGLGLSITHNLVRMMGGQISVESKKGTGSTFDVLLSLQRAAQETGRTEAARLPELSVLIVDDDPVTCEHTGGLLREIGVSAQWVSSGEEALKRIEEQYRKDSPFDIAIIDWKMPKMDGMETVRRIRKQFGRELLVIIMSAYDWSEIEREAHLSGVDLFLAKPIFRNHIRRVLEQAANLEAKLPGKAPKMEFQNERVLLVEDNEINMEIARTILEMNGLTVDTAVNGEEAVERFVLSNPGDYQMILMDIRMPKMDGLEATRRIRSSGKPHAKTIPIVAMSANAFEDERENARLAGMDDYLTKPVEAETLFSALRNYIKS